MLKEKVIYYEKSFYEQIFEIIDEMYNSLSQKSDTDPNILKVLMTDGAN